MRERKEHGTPTERDQLAGRSLVEQKGEKKIRFFVVLVLSSAFRIVFDSYVDCILYIIIL